MTISYHGWRTSGVAKVLGTTGALERKTRFERFNAQQHQHHRIRSVGRGHDIIYYLGRQKVEDSPSSETSYYLIVIIVSKLLRERLHWLEKRCNDETVRTRL